MSHQALRDADHIRTAHRIWLDRVHAHGPELLQVLKDLIPITERAVNLSSSVYGQDEWSKIGDRMDRAHNLIAKLEGTQ